MSAAQFDLYKKFGLKESVTGFTKSEKKKQNKQTKQNDKLKRFNLTVSSLKSN